MPSFCARTNGCAKRTVFSGFEPDKKTVWGTVFPANGGRCKKSGDVLRGSKAVKFQYIAEYRGTLTRSHLCRLMGVSERGFHAWKHRPPSHRQRRDMVLLAHIRDQHRLSLGSYGRPRMTEELNELGIRVGQRRVGRLMRQNGVQIIRSKKFKRTTDSDHAFNIAPNLLQQDFTASGPNQKWAGDITYVWTREGWVYLAVIIDLFSRRVVGWAISNRMKQDLALRALNMAIHCPAADVYIRERGDPTAAARLHSPLCRCPDYADVVA